MQVAQSGSFNLGFVSMPIVFQDAIGADLRGHVVRPAFLRGHPLPQQWRRPSSPSSARSSATAAKRFPGLWGVAFGFGLLTIFWYSTASSGSGTTGRQNSVLAVMAFIEVILFMWVFKPENAWASLHQGADIRIGMFKFIMTYVTPLYLGIILVWWAVTRAIPILTLQGGVAAGGQSARWGDLRAPTASDRRDSGLLPGNDPHRLEAQRLR